MEPAVAMEEPAVAMEEPAVAMEEPAVAMEEPAVAMEAPAAALEASAAAATAQEHARQDPRGHGKAFKYILRRRRFRNRAASLRNGPLGAVCEFLPYVWRRPRFRDAVRLDWQSAADRAALEQLQLETEAQAILCHCVDCAVVTRTLETRQFKCRDLNCADKVAFDDLLDLLEHQRARHGRVSLLCRRAVETLGHSVDRANFSAFRLPPPTVYAFQQFLHPAVRPMPWTQERVLEERERIHAGLKQRVVSWLTRKYLEHAFEIAAAKVAAMGDTELASQRNQAMEFYHSALLDMPGDVHTVDDGSFAVGPGRNWLLTDDPENAQFLNQFTYHWGKEDKRGDGEIELFSSQGPALTTPAPLPPPRPAAVAADLTVSKAPLPSLKRVAPKAPPNPVNVRFVRPLAANTFEVRMRKAGILTSNPTPTAASSESVTAPDAPAVVEDVTTLIMDELANRRFESINEVRAVVHDFERRIDKAFQLKSRGTQLNVNCKSSECQFYMRFYQKQVTGGKRLPWWFLSNFCGKHTNCEIDATFALVPIPKRFSTQEVVADALSRPGSIRGMMLQAAWLNTPGKKKADSVTSDPTSTATPSDSVTVASAAVEDMSTLVTATLANRKFETYSKLKEAVFDFEWRYGKALKMVHASTLLQVNCESPECQFYMRFYQRRGAGSAYLPWWYLASFCGEHTNCEAEAVSTPGEMVADVPSQQRNIHYIFPRAATQYGIKRKLGVITSDPTSAAAPGGSETATSAATEDVSALIMEKLAHRRFESVKGMRAVVKDLESRCGKSLMGQKVGSGFRVECASPGCPFLMRFYRPKSGAGKIVSRWHLSNFCGEHTCTSVPEPTEQRRRRRQRRRVDTSPTEPSAALQALGSSGISVL